VIVDASVAIKWLVTEDLSRSATRLLSRDDLAAPGILDVEVGHFLTRKVRQRVLGRLEAERMWAELADAPVARENVEEAADDAFDLSLRLNAALIDCLYLGLAIHLDDMLVTADERFVRATRAEPSLRGYIRSLTEL